MSALKDSVDRSRERAIADAIRRAGGNVADAARDLKIRPSWLYTLLGRSGALRRALADARERNAGRVRGRGRPKKGGERR